jgi:hypothetical protein
MFLRRELTPRQGTDVSGHGACHRSPHPTGACRMHGRSVELNYNEVIGA